LTFVSFEISLTFEAMSKAFQDLQSQVMSLDVGAGRFMCSNLKGKCDEEEEGLMPSFLS
jgi:hypothetical protein